MRVLVLTADLPPHVHSGVGTAVAWSVQALTTQGCSVDVLTTAPKAYVPGASVTHLDAPCFPSHLRGSSVVHLHSLRLADLAWELKKRDGSALLYTAHTLLERELDESRSSRLWQTRQRRCFQHADHVIFLSNAERAAAISLCPSVAERSTVLPNAIPAAAATTPKEQCPPLVLFAGRFCLSKGVDVAAAAMDMLLRRRPHVHCALAGGKGEPPWEELTHGLARRYPGRCVAPGWLPHAELQEWLQRASLLVMPSRYEPFGMVALEALRIGLPVLGARIDGLRELLAEGSGAATIRGHDPEDWTNAVGSLLDDRRLRLEMRACGPLFVQSHFGLEAHGRRYASVLRRCRAECAPPPSATTPANQRAA